ncbi:uncharacterized protein LOC144618622 [Crassostrea virginica]
MLMQGQRTARDFLQCLGIVASCIDLIPNARLYMRPIQLHLLSFWKPSSQDLEKIIPITQHLIQHLQWWLHSVNISRGRSLQLEEAGVTTDASLTGYGGHLNNQIVQGKWDKRHKHLHINCLEMEAVFLSLKHFQKQIQNKTVLIRCDNTTVVQYINKQGGTKSPRLCYQTWELWNWAIDQNIKLKAAHIAGKSNILADQLSRSFNISDNTTVNSNSPMLAKKTLVHRATSTSNFNTKKSSKHSKFTASTQHKNLSSKSRSTAVDCMASIDRGFKKKGFSKDTRTLLAASIRSGTQKDYSCKFKQFSSWCCLREIDPYSASLVEVANFLTDLYTKGLQYRTIAGYRSMLSSVLPPVDNVAVGQHPYIIRLIKGVFNSRAPKVRLVPAWNLPMVLDMLQRSPFEPITNATLKHLAYKTVYLTAITTFRRCSDLQSLRLGECFINKQRKGVTFIRQGLAKQDRPNHYGTKIFVPAFSENKLLDPKRSLYFYVKKTEEYRQNLKTDNNKLFLSLLEPNQAVAS